MYKLGASERLVADPFKIYTDDIWNTFELSETPGTLISFLDSMKSKFKAWARSHLSAYVAEGLIDLYGNIQVQLDFEFEVLQKSLTQRYGRENKLAEDVSKLRTKLDLTEVKLKRSQEEEVSLRADQDNTRSNYEE